MKRFYFLILFLLTSRVMAADAAQQLQQFLAGLNTLQAQFEQTIVTPDGESYFSKGTLYLSRPGRFRWEYHPPAEQLIVADGSRVWLFDKELDQISHRSQDDLLEGTPAQIFSEKGSLDAHFEIVEAEQRDGLNWVLLIPKDPESQFASITLGLMGDQLQRMELVDQFNQVTLYRFTAIQRNPALDKTLFEFTPPPLIDVLSD